MDEELTTSGFTAGTSASVLGFRVSFTVTASVEVEATVVSLTSSSVVIGCSCIVVGIGSIFSVKGASEAKVSAEDGSVAAFSDVVVGSGVVVVLVVVVDGVVVEVTVVVSSVVDVEVFM